mmetsp:Transcript_16406/g.19976  ORF Transcript_16406/g.19976 Transcript_16406/m.19976 type:complete len:267 (-) Transcript_16406:698-1498(-)
MLIHPSCARGQQQQQRVVHRWCSRHPWKHLLSRGGVSEVWHLPSWRFSRDQRMWHEVCYLDCWCWTSAAVTIARKTAAWAGSKWTPSRKCRRYSDPNSDVSSWGCAAVCRLRSCHCQSTSTPPQPTVPHDGRWIDAGLRHCRCRRIPMHQWSRPVSTPRPRSRWLRVAMHRRAGYCCCCVWRTPTAPKGNFQRRDGTHLHHRPRRRRRDCQRSHRVPERRRQRPLSERAVCVSVRRGSNSSWNSSWKTNLSIWKEPQTRLSCCCCC